MAEAHRPARAFLVALALTVLAGPPLVARGATWQASFPPPTPVPPNGSPSPYPTALQTPPPGFAPPPLRAEAAVLMELDGGRTLYSIDARERRPIASLTKIMTALLVLERVAAQEPVVVSETAAAQSGAELGLRVGETQPVGELLHALLLQSANDAAVALAEHVAGTVDGFVAEMNARASALGLRDTTFFSPNGLDDRGYSTALDLARLTAEALRFPEISRIVATKVHDVRAPSGPARHLQNRNALLWLYPGTVGVKTGFTSAAGYCLVAVAERGGERYLVVLLGEPAQAWNDAAALLDHAFASYDRRSVLADGEALDPVTVGTVEVPAVADGDVEAYVHERRPRVRVEVIARPGLAFPLQEGDPLGEAVVHIGGTEAGRAPVVVGDLPDPPGAGRPYWVRMVYVLTALFGRLIQEG